MDVVEAAVGHDDDEIPAFCLARNRADDIGRGGNETGIHVRCAQVANDLFGIQPLGFRQRGTEDGGKNDVMRAS